MGRKFSLVGISLALLGFFLFLAIFIWQIAPQYLSSSLEKGFKVAFDIFLIIFGAVFFIDILNKEKIIQSVGFYLESFSKDIRIQVIFLAWFFENLIEGIAGFGTPSAIVAPLLIGLGLTPIHAVIISLFGNSAAGAFGAAGTPIRVGFAGINTAGVNYFTALFNFAGILVPAFILWTLSQGRKDRWLFFKEGLPFALWSGFIFWIFSFGAVFLGGEFPTIIASLLGLFVAVLTAKLKILTSKNTAYRENRQELVAHHSLPMAVFPYLLVILLLAGGKFISRGFNPGFALVISGLIVFVVTRRKFGETIPEAVKNAFLRTGEPFAVIFAMSTIVQLILNSGHNYSNLPSMLKTISAGFENPLLPFFAPVAGAFGAFISGSVTMSNILFGNFLKMASEVMKMDPAKILGLFVAGAAAGNMMALTDIMTAEAVAKIKSREREIIKRVLLPCIIYVSLTGLAGLIFI